MVDLEMNRRREEPVFGYCQCCRPGNSIGPPLSPPAGLKSISLSRDHDNVVFS